MKGKILIVEDDPLIADMLKRYLEKEGFKTYWDSTGAEAVKSFETLKPDVVILDLMLPDTDGFELCKLFSSTDSMLLILTARDADEDKIVGLELGADDYITKPFNMRELLARVKALLRRRKKLSLSGETLRVGELEIHTGEMKVLLKGRLVDLTPKEFLILKKLLSKRGKVVSREEIVSEIYSGDIPYYERIVDTYIYRIRTKLMEIERSYAERIKTVRGFGYRFE
ncbi:response regulator transcription factor [Hydrogenivirga sp. 128-5-R1-1]|uniref:response regulator transcription factor n=1 Tax=Hydrogenivirga sp. 128-5-R1-1 TaxID=392423 RepID=UPI00015EF09E|nr:response regulator transcription factor [Hydrogenivirga sp. 128-5-R1-1]EDP74705.1 two component transcriptional regulator, winged helix family protein [Hydrogenivirga sp. 128-5-R1-1]